VPEFAGLSLGSLGDHGLRFGEGVAPSAPTAPALEATP
jgi:hypothetical protein